MPDSPIPRSRRGYAELGSTALAGSPADFGKLIADETEKWGKVIRAANIKAGVSRTLAPTFHNCPFREWL